MSSYEYYELEQMLGGLAAASAGLNLVSFGLAVLTYVLSSLGIYTVAKRRGIHNAWLSWVPVANVWILGSLSDQYRYVAKGQVKAKRKALIIMEIINAAVLVILVCVLVGAIVGVVTDAAMGYASEEELFMSVVGPIMGVMVLMLPLAGLSIAILVVRYMALYDIYMSMEPENAVLYLVLSIFFNVTEPFFLFFNRQKDKGMPPRRPVFRDPQQTWETNPAEPYAEAPAEKPYGESGDHPEIPSGEEPQNEDEHFL